MLSDGEHKLHPGVIIGYKKGSVEQIIYLVFTIGADEPTPINIQWTICSKAHHQQLTFMYVDSS
eukprot:8114948-Karenia_brevis.AAC.1